MSTIKTTLAGLDGLRASLRTLPDAARRGVTLGLRAVAEEAADDLRRSLSQAPGSPSPPGRSPGDAKGRIAEAITIEAAADGTIQLAVNLPFAADLEFGTNRGAARPFLRPAAARAGQEASRVLAASLADALKDPNP